MKLKEIKLKLQDLSCNQNYSTKQDRYLSSDIQRIIKGSLNSLEKILLYSVDFGDFDSSQIRELLFQSMLKNFDKYQEISIILDVVDELELSLIQINLIQSKESKFVYKETIEPFNQV